MAQVIEPTAGTHLGGPFEVVVKVRSEDTNGVLAAIEQTVPPRKLIPPHTHENDVWDHVLTGEFGILVGDEVEHAGAGSWALKPRNVVHAMWNRTDALARIIEVLTPAETERWFEETAALAPGDREGFAASCERHGIRWLPDSPWRDELSQRYDLVEPTWSGAWRRLTRETSTVGIPETRFAKSGEVQIAYKVFGRGRFDVVFVGGLDFDTVEAVEIPPLPERVGAFLTQADSLMRLIRFDKRRTGSSDRVAGVPSLEERMDDVRAVMDAVGSEAAALFGQLDGAAMSLLFAATYPERTFALVLWQPKPRFVRAPDFPWAPTREEYERQTERYDEAWVTQGSVAQVRRWLAAVGGPTDEDSVRRQALLVRLSARTGAYLERRRMNMEIDVRQILPSIHVPTLLVQRSVDQFDAGDTSATEIAGYMAERMPNARTHEVARDAWEHDGLLSDPVMEFLGEAWEQWTRRAVEPERALATVLFTDIVASTGKAVELGPRWQELLREHNALIRRELSRYRGREIDTAGDGFFASGFDGPARAIRCACAIRDAVSSLGFGIRVGVHTGECDVVDGKLAGLAVAVGARVAGQAGVGEVLVSGTVT